MLVRSAIEIGEYSEVTENGLTITVSVRDNIKWRGKRNRDIIFISHEAESVMEHLANRRNRPLEFYRQEVLPTVTKLAGLAEDTRYRWAQKAGCHCPCSPGFMANTASYNGKDIFVHVSKEAPLSMEVA